MKIHNSERDKNDSFCVWAQNITRLSIQFSRTNFEFLLFEARQQARKTPLSVPDVNISSSYFSLRYLREKLKETLLVLKHHALYTYRRGREKEVRLHAFLSSV
jgi:hypothetical protein